MSKDINARIVCKHDSPSNWDKATNFIPKLGEIIIYDAEGNVTPRMKIGDGITNVNQLLFSTTGISNYNNGEIFNNYIDNQAIGEYSHAEGDNTMALGACSHASGEQTIAGGKGYKITYVETVTDEDNNISVNSIGFEIGSLTEQEFLNTCNWQEGDMFSVSVDEYYQWDFCGTLTGTPRFDEGTVYWSCITTDYGDKKLSDLSEPDFTSTYISVIYVPTKPCGTITVGSHAHAEGYNTVAASRYAHAEGNQNQAGYSAHAEGQSTIAKGLNSHSEGYKTEAIGATSHAEGSQTQAIGNISHAEGYKTKSSGTHSHAEGNQTAATGKASHAEGQSTQAAGEFSHAEGWQSEATGPYAHAEGYLTDSTGVCSHAEGNQTTALGEASHSEGYGSDATGTYAHAEGYNTQASGDHSHSEGRLAKATGSESHAEGYNTKAIGIRSHAEGRMTTAQGDCSHSEGSATLAAGSRSHVEGINTIAYSADSHAEGSNTIAGTVNKTAKSQGAHVQGRYNLEDTEEKYAHIVGNGTSGGRSNAHTLDWEGNAWFAGDVKSGSGKLATEAYVQEEVAALVDSSPSTLNTLNELAQALGDDPNFATTVTAELGKKVNKDEFPAIAKGEEESSIVANDITTNKTLGINSIALGTHNIAGAKGFYIKNLDVTNKKIHLTTTECNPTFEENYSSDEVVDSTVDITGYEVGDYIDITAYTHYHWILCTKISEVGSDYIVYETDINDPRNILTNITDEETGEQKDVKYILSVPNKPQIGSVVYTDTSFVEGSNNISAGQFAHAEGYGTISSGRYSHAEGLETVSGYAAHAEGQSTKATGINSHAEGYMTESTGSTSHAEGYKSKSIGHYSHAEGSVTEASGRYAHSEGQSTEASGEASHAEGFSSQSKGSASHAEGYSTAYALRAHAEGSNTHAYGQYSHAEGNQCKAGDENNVDVSQKGDSAHAEGMITKAIGRASHAEGRETTASGNYSHAEGQGTIASNACAGQHVQGKYNIEDINGIYAHIVGNGGASLRKNIHTLDWNGNVWYKGDIYVGSTSGLDKDEGSKKLATEEYVNNYRVIAGQKANTDLGAEATAEGYKTTASGPRSHAEGRLTEATAAAAHSEGDATKAYGPRAHAEGFNTQALFNDTHSEGYYTVAGSSTGGQGAHAEGMETTATGKASHAEGRGTIASGEYQHVQGRWNLEEPTGNYLHIVGNGNSSSDRSNAHTLDENGNAWYQGTITTGTSTAPHRGILIGTTEPNDSLGQDGDIYIMYV